jgi:hypothetical protein
MTSERLSRSYLLLALLSLLLMKPYAFYTSISEQDTPQPLRRVNMPHFSSDIDWAETALFWFGKNEQGVPSRNYTDVRIAYTDQALHVRATIVDYYLWYNVDPTKDDDLTKYDAVAIYLDTNFDQATAPQTDDYTFLVGAHHWPNENATQYHRQARGTGTDWDHGWTGEWTDYEAMQWYCNPGPNNNDCGIDYGWSTIFIIPWETLGRSGPPEKGTLWGLGIRLYDRDDQPPAGYVAPEHWPETLAQNRPETWGELHFGYTEYDRPAVTFEGSTVIRAISPQDNSVQDAWMGGGGTCSGGHEGGTEINHGDDTGLYVGTETAPTHFPCFNKSYLRFSLDAIPRGKEIISASLTLHLWGHAGDPGQAYPSWVHLFTVTDPWEEMSIHWNSAPLPQENIAATWVYPYSGDSSNPDWPGDPYTWDATQAVAEAYTKGQPVSMALYSSDKDQHSSKYLTASETGDWNTEGRPTLTVFWGHAPARLKKTVWPIVVRSDERITYTLTWLGTGQTLTVTDQLPPGLSIPGPIDVSIGNADYNSATRQVTWTGTTIAGRPITVSIPVTVQIEGPAILTNTATLFTAIERVPSDIVIVLISGYDVYLPLIRKKEQFRP